MDPKFKTLFICAGSAFIAGPLLYLILSGSGAVKALLIAVLISLLAAAGVFLVATFLRAKDKKVRIAIYVAISLTALFAIFCLTIINLAPLALFHPRFTETSYNELTAMTGSSSDPEWIETSTGIRGWRVPAKTASSDSKRPVILFFGGNGMESSSFVREYLIKDSSVYGSLTENNDFIFLDYPQYGKSSGNLTVDGLKNMALESFDHVRSLKTSGKIFCMGYSLGTGLATYVASERADDVSGLILLAPYENSYALYNNELNIFHGPLKLLVTYNLDTGAYAKTVKCPTIIFASPEDEVVPYQSSRLLFTDFMASSVNFVTVDGNRHNDFMADRKVMQQAGDFIGGLN